MEKIYDQMLMKSEKVMQMEEKLKEYKKEIQRQKADKAELQDINDKKIKQLNSEMEAIQKNTQFAKEKQLIQLSEREFELKNRILMLE